MGNKIESVRSNNTFWYKIHVFIYDLQNFRSSDTARDRLNGVFDPAYIGVPYIEPQDADLLKGVVVQGPKTLEEVIHETIAECVERRKKKILETGDHRIVATHDISLIFEKVFDIDYKRLEKDEHFLKPVGDGGLRLKGQTWEGCPRKSQ